MEKPIGPERTALTAPRAALLMLVLVLAAGPGAAAPGSAGSAPGTPALVVLISVDQMRADYPARFGAYFGERGFRRIGREGRVFLDASYSHAITMTGPGHSVIGSGEYGDRTGIVGNHWYSYTEGRDVYCASAPVGKGGAGACLSEGAPGDAAAIGSPEKSPCRSLGRTLGKRVKMRYPEARVVGVAVKDRAAILMAGKQADAAYWLEEREDGSASLACSGYYPRCRPEVLAWGNEEGLSRKPSDSSSGSLFKRHPAWKLWSWSLPVPQGKVCPDDVTEAHAAVPGLGKSFPHPVKDVATLLYTPYGNDLVEAMAERAVRIHDLGRNPARAPDLLAVGFSSTDYFGHVFGPDSCEAADGMKRLDATLGRFLDFLEARVGKGRLLVFLTGDHGVAPLPEVSLEKGIPAGRLDLGARVDRAKGKIGDLPPIRQRMEYFLARELGAVRNAATPLSEAYVAAFDEPNLYLARDRIGAAALPLARERLKDYLLHVEGVAQVFTWDELAAGGAPEKVLRSFTKERSGDLFVVLRPYWIPLGPGRGTDHGQIYAYDARVPLMAWGGEVAPGIEAGAVDVAQIAPTVASILGLDGTGFSVPSPLPLAGE